MRSNLIIAAGLFLACIISLLVLDLEDRIVPFDLRNEEKNDFGCGNTIMINNESELEKKTIYLVENLVKATPHLGCRMWNTYEKVAKVALEIYEEDGAKYQPVIKFFNEQAPSLDPLRPASIIDYTAKSDALITVGFAWSTMAGTAAQQSLTSQMPYVSPTGVIRSINEGDFSVSLGTNINLIIDGYEYLIKKQGIKHVILTENTSQIQEREYASTIKSVSIPSIEHIQYQGDFPIEKILNSIREHKSVLVVVPGYVSLKNDVSEILKIEPETFFLLGPQWSHDHKLLDFSGNLFCISDYYNFLDNEMHRRVEKKWYEVGGEEIIGGYLFSLFDALFFAIKALEETNSRDEVTKKIKNMRFEGTKGPLKISQGTVSKNIYLLKYETKKGFELVKSF